MTAKAQPVLWSEPFSTIKLPQMLSFLRKSARWEGHSNKRGQSELSIDEDMVKKRVS